MEFDEEEIEEEETPEENFQGVYEKLDELDKQELKYLREQLDKIYQEEGGLQTVVTDKNLKRRIAKICLKLIDETSEQINERMRTAYVITGNFVWVSYEDRLDEVMNLAGELELPENQISEDPKELWTEMRNILVEYLKSN